jgi:2-polyprenyl-3-methyl-5-hydroxy-6-metoxy-1,4-benzoquinol methylase
MFTCRICGNKAGNTVHTGIEKKMGTKDKFNYIKCSRCGCLQIEEYPLNIAQYYNRYYSLSQPQTKERVIVSWLRKQLFSYLLRKRNLVGKFIFPFLGKSFYWIFPHKYSFNSSIIDIGCGYGRLAVKMAQSGFKNMEGIDPFLQNDIEYTLHNNQHLTIRKTDLYTLEKQYDVIMLHHVLEHLPNQHEVFEKLKTLMHKNSVLIVNIPLMDEYHWKNFGMNAFQLNDVPRHYYLHTLNSVNLVAEEHHLKIDEIKFYGEQKLAKRKESGLVVLYMSKS